MRLLSLNDCELHTMLNQKYFPKISKNYQFQKDLKSKKSVNKLIQKKSYNISKFVTDPVKIDLNNLSSTSNNDDQVFYHTQHNKTNDNIYNFKQNFQRRPKLIQYIHPEYPSKAKTLGIEGKLRVIYNINNIGKVEKIRILFANPSGLFEENVKSAMRRWIYDIQQPQKDLIITFQFSLNTISIVNA